MLPSGPVIASVGIPLVKLADAVPLESAPKEP